MGIDGRYAQGHDQGLAVAASGEKLGGKKMSRAGTDGFRKEEKRHLVLYNRRLT